MQIRFFPLPHTYIISEIVFNGENLIGKNNFVKTSILHLIILYFSHNRYLET